MAAQPAPAAAAVPAAAPVPSKPVDPLDELFGAPAPAAAPMPAAVPQGPASYGSTGMYGIPVAAASYGPPPPAAPVAGLGPGSGSMALYGSYGLPGGAMASAGSGATGFTSAPSWSSVQGMHGLHPAASTGSTYSAGYGDPFGQAVAAAGLTGMGTGAAAAGFHQPQQQPAAAGSMGFDDAAFVEDWRVLGDVQQWYRTLLTKEKVIMAAGIRARHTACIKAIAGWPGIGVDAFTCKKHCMLLQCFSQ